MQDQDTLSLGSAAINSELRRLMLVNKRHLDGSMEGGGHDVALSAALSSMQQQPRNGSAPPQLDDMTGSRFYPDGPRSNLFTGTPTAASTFARSFDAAGFGRCSTDDRWVNKT